MALPVEWGCTVSAAYDYNRQRWINGAEAASLGREQLLAELDLLRGPRAAEYLRFTGSALSVEDALQCVLAQLSEDGGVR